MTDPAPTAANLAVWLARRGSGPLDPWWPWTPEPEPEPEPPPAVSHVPGPYDIDPGAFLVQVDDGWFASPAE